MNKIMAVRNELFDKFERNKLLQMRDKYEIMAIIHTSHIYANRSELENDPKFRQPIPYCLVTNGNEQFVLMQRVSGEARLMGKHYIGVGGHVEDGHSIDYTALKEITEEIGLPIGTLEIMGAIISDHSEVENVHIGIVYAAATSYTEFTSPENHNAQWASRKVLLDHYPHCEKWSQIVMTDFLGIRQ